MWRLLQRLGVFQLSYVAGSFDQTAFNEGRRNEGNRLMDHIREHCPGRFTEMQKEAKSYERRSTSGK